MQLAHGGDITGYLDEFGVAPLDFSSNISMLGLPQEVRDAVVCALDRADEYPDPKCRRLREAIADYEGISAAHVACGNGCADLIYRLALAARPAAALMPAPTFSEYADALAVTGSRIVRHRLSPSKGFALDDGFIEAIVPGIEMAFVCQPNNPTGTLADRAFLERVLARCEEAGARLVVDECFVGFLDDPAVVSVVDLVEDHPALIVLKAFTKLYAMPGIRLGGMLCSDEGLLEKMEAVGQPWSVSGLAQAAGIAALGCEKYVELARLATSRERSFLKRELAMRGIEARGCANFLFFQLDDGGALAAKMRECDILIRDCSNYEGLGPGSYRIAVKSHKDNLQLLKALDNML